MSVNYGDYIASPEWRATRDRYWASKLPKVCQGCGMSERRGMHLHHRTYERLGHERLTDLVPLCQPCHEAVHAYQRRTGTYLWKATRQVLRKQRDRQRKPLTLTEADIERGKTKSGGYGRAQLAEWGVPWPPPKGWKQKLLTGQCVRESTIS